MRSAHFVIPLLAAILAAPVVHADVATAVGAKRLEGVFRDVLGSAPGAVAVAPNGESYDVSIDLAGVWPKGKAARLDVAPVRMQITDLGGGLWRVSEDQDWQLRLNVPDRIDLEAKVARMAFDGVFDTGLKAFASGHGTVEGLEIDQSQTDPNGTAFHVHRRQALQRFDLAGLAAEPPGAGVNAAAHLVTSEAVQEVDFAEASGARSHSVARLGPSTADVTAKGVRTAGILALAGYFAAHPTEVQMLATQERMKTMIAGALPLFDSLDVSTHVDGVELDIPAGKASAGSVDLAFGLSGIVKDAHLHEHVAAEDIVLPAGLLPDWAAPLAPTRAVFDLSVIGFDLADPAAMILRAFDLAASPQISAATRDGLPGAFLPDGVLTIGTRGISVEGPLYSVSAAGAVEVGPEGPPRGGAVTITAKGIEAVSQALGAAPADIRRQAFLMLLAAKGLARQETDGTLTWKIEPAPGGGVMVNGQNFSPAH